MKTTREEVASEQKKKQKQTAVEWLVQQLYKVNWNEMTHEERMNICCTAKLKEKEQIIEAHRTCSIECGFEHSADDWSNNYYNETFKDK